MAFEEDQGPHPDDIYGPLHIFEMEGQPDTDDTEGTPGPIHLVALMNPDLLNGRDLPKHAVLGSFEPNEAGDFTPDTFERNDEFVLAFIDYMNESLDKVTELHDLAKDMPGKALYMVDPRFDSTERPEEESEDPEPADVVGCYRVDQNGSIISQSFEYNEYHQLFHPEHGVSGILTPTLHDWLARRAGLIE